MELKRSWMFVPGHRQRMIDKALELNADVIMLDLEDGVAPAEKDTARRLISEALGREQAQGSPLRFVRINAIAHARMAADLEAVLRPGFCHAIHSSQGDSRRQALACRRGREARCQATAVAGGENPGRNH